MSRINLIEERLTRSVIGAFFEVYNSLGFGFLEHIYVMALERELLARGHRVAREVSVHVRYKGHVLGIQRIDMIVDERLVVETKSTLELAKQAQRQVFNYLRATNLEVGLLLHFGPEARFYRLISSNTGEASA
jgi:GxxExxY protein